MLNKGNLCCILSVFHKRLGYFLTESVAAPTKGLLVCVCMHIYIYRHTTYLNRQFKPKKGKQKCTNL